MSLSAPTTLAVIALYTLAAAMSGWVFRQSLKLGSLPGCGKSSACDAITQGRWSRLGPVPVSGLGMFVYIALAAMSFVYSLNLSESAGRRTQTVLLILATLVVISAVWFIGLQLFVIGQICVYCMGIHFFGIIAAILTVVQCWPPIYSDLFFPLTVAVGIVGALIAGQLFFRAQTFAVIPAPSGAIENMASTPAQPAEEKSVIQQAVYPPDYIAPTGLLLMFNGRVVVDMSQHPLVGISNAEFIIGYLLDYTCSECHHLHRLLYEAMDHYAGRLAIVPILVPLNKSCNPAIDCPKQEKAQACAYARLSRAVWTANPARYEEWDRFMASEREIQPFGLALAKANELADIRSFSLKEPDPALDQQLVTDIALYKAAGKPQIPCLLLTKGALIGRVPSKTVLIELLHKHLLTSPSISQDALST